MICGCAKQLAASTFAFAWALADLARAGLHVIPITGRPVGWSEPFARDWPVDAIVAENGAVLKPSAATPALMNHTGRAVVFESIEDYHARIDDPALDIDETCVMVLKYVGPVGYPGMPEVGNMALPKKLLQKGITDMVRISDGRMSGTAYGTVVLHVAPEAAAEARAAAQSPETRRPARSATRWHAAV